jgi:hypothetical protein
MNPINDLKIAQQYQRQLAAELAAHRYRQPLRLRRRAEKWSRF